MVIIIGGGLSGLITAFRLKQAKIPFQILEAQDRIGGRIYTKMTNDQTPIELGATWFGRQHQNLIKVLNELELAIFLQFKGEYYYFDDPESPHNGKYKLPQQEPSYRISGGSKSLIEKLFDKLEDEDIKFGTRVKEIGTEKEEVFIRTYNDDIYRADQVILAVPPKIWSHQINFVTPLPQELIQTAKSTQTWMEDSLKAAVEFKKPFWREDGLPATIMSNFGPFIECYDHSNDQKDRFALCGFLNPEFKRIDSVRRQKLVLKQLSKILGDKALDALSYQEYIWSENDYVKWPKDKFMQPHQNNGHPIFRQPFLDNRLIISSSESASTFPGYMDGAIEAGERAFRTVSNNLKMDKISK